MKKTIVLLITLMAVSKGFSQNIVHLEMLGPGLIYSLNYERMLSEKFSARIGMGVLNTEGEIDIETGDNTTVIEVDKDEAIRMTAIPIGVNYLMGGNHKFEVGVGATILKFEGGQNVDILGQDLEADFVGYYYGFGYRYQKTTSGLFFRTTGYWLMLGDHEINAGEPEDISVPWWGMTFGWAF